jgi:hypothetical protein
MKRLLALLLLAGCDSSKEPTSGAAPTQVPPDLDLAPPVASQAELETKARTAVSAAVLDPGSAEYQGIRAGSAGSVCGEVNAKGDNGKLQGFRPFVVSPEGVAVVSSAAAIRWDEPGDLYPDFYIRYCAPPQELPALAARMAQRNAAATPAEVPPAEVPLAAGEIPPDAKLPPMSLPPDPPPPPPPVAQAAPRPVPATPTNPNDESFFNAVMRPAESNGKAQ